MKYCPHCDSKISNTALKCKFCGERVINKLDTGKHVKNFKKNSTIEIPEKKKNKTIYSGNKALSMVSLIILTCLICLLLDFVVLLFFSSPKQGFFGYCKGTDGGIHKKPLYSHCDIDNSQLGWTCDYGYFAIFRGGDINDNKSRYCGKD